MIRWSSWMPHRELAELMGEATLVAAHAGVGAIFTALSAGHRPLVVPRLATFGEHVDNHQLQIASHLGNAGLVIPCLEVGDVARCATAAGQQTGPMRRPPASLVDAVQNDVAMSVDHNRPARRGGRRRARWTSLGHSA